MDTRCATLPRNPHRMLLMLFSLISSPFLSSLKCFSPLTPLILRPAKSHGEETGAWSRAGFLDPHPSKKDREGHVASLIPQSSLSPTSFLYAATALHHTERRQRQSETERQRQKPCTPTDMHLHTHDTYPVFTSRSPFRPRYFPLLRPFKFPFPPSLNLLAPVKQP